MKTIVFLIDKIDTSGVINSLLGFCKALRGSFVVYICAFNKSEDIKKETELKNNTYGINFFKPYFFKKIKNKIIRNLFMIFSQKCLSNKILKKIVGDLKPDILIDFECLFPELIKKRRNYKQFIWIHGDCLTNPYFNNSRKTKELAFRNSFNSADRIVSVSKKMNENFIKRFGNQYKATYIYNPFDLEHIKKCAKEKPSIYYDKNVVNVVCVSRLSEGKGIERLINISQRLKNDVGKIFHFYVIGSGELLATFYSDDVITFMGKKENPYPYIKMADFVIMPSESEAYSTVTAESLILGIPVLSTNVGSCDEMIINNFSGLIVENNLQDLYEGTKNMITSKSFLKMKKNINEGYDPTSYYAKGRTILDLFQK